MDKGKIYAQALYESSPHKSSLLIDDLLLIEKTLEYGLKKILDNPVLGKDRKKSLIEKLFKQYIATETITFSQFLVETNEIQLLPKIRLALERLMNKKDKITKVQVISARELETDLLNDIALNLGKKLKKTLSV
jgi:ATP synthase F1 delta subunit